MTERQFATLRALQVAVILILALSVGSDVYLGLQLSQNSRVFDRIYTLLESGLSERLSGALVQAAAIEKGLSELQAQIGETRA